MNSLKDFTNQLSQPQICQFCNQCMEVFSCSMLTITIDYYCPHCDYYTEITNQQMTFLWYERKIENQIYKISFILTPPQQTCLYILKVYDDVFDFNKEYFSEILHLDYLINVSPNNVMNKISNLLTLT